MQVQTDTRLSERQQAVLDYITQYVADNPYPPSRREIQVALDISSTSVVEYALMGLETKGYLELRGGVTRGIVLTNPPKQVCPNCGHAI